MFQYFLYFQVIQRNMQKAQIAYFVHFLFYFVLLYAGMPFLTGIHGCLDWVLKQELVLFAKANVPLSREKG